jgi:hypothetical protein
VAPSQSVMSRARVAFLVAGALYACEPPVSSPRVEVTVTDSAGVEVFTSGDIPAWDEPRLQWGLTVEREIATADEDLSATPMIFDPQGVTRFPDGTLVVLDGAGLRIVVVDSVRDSVTARFGPSGQGPGEVWSSISQIWPEEDGTLGVLDPGNRRVSYFSLRGDLLHSNPVDIPGGGGRIVQRPGTYETFAWRYFFDRETGSTSDSVLRVPVSGPAVSVAPLPHERAPRPGGSTPLFSGSGTFAPIGSGGVMVGRTDVAEFRLFSDAGELQSVIRLPFERRPLTLEDERIVREVAGSAPSLADGLGEFNILWSRLEPLGDSLFALDQTSVTTPDGETRIPMDTRVWRILSIRGHYLGSLVLPRGVGPPYWTDGERLLAVRSDALGVATIVVYRLEAP